MSPAVPASELRPDLAPFDRVKFWRVVRWTPEGPVQRAVTGIGQLGAHRIVTKRDVGHVLRVHVTTTENPSDRRSVEYVPIDAAQWFDPHQLSFDVA